MAYEYSDPARAEDSYSLPDVEVFYDRISYSDCCTVPVPREYADACADQPCPSCEKEATFTPIEQGPQWRYWYWFCFPGCLPDSDTFGPFDTEEQALADARDQD